MRHRVLLNRILPIVVVLFFVGTANSQQTDTVKTPVADTAKPAAAPAESGASKMYYGGYVGASFGDYSSIEISPMVGWHFTPVLSGGLRGSYEYVWVDDFNASNYGGAAFAIARVHPKVFLQAEFQYMSYEWPTIGGATEREWVPFLYLGGGFVQPLGGNASLVASVMVDVLQDDNSPYQDWEPTFSVGVIAGF